MLLRASSEIEGGKADLHAVTDGTRSGVPEGDVLIPFAEAALAPDVEALAEARSQAEVGFNKWLAGENVKWTSDVGFSFSTINDGGEAAPHAGYASSGNGWRPDNAGDSGQWLIRSQLQLLF